MLQTAPTARRGRERQGTLPTTDRARNRTATPSQPPFSAREGSPEGRRRRGGGEGEQWKHFRTPLAATVLSALGGSQTVPPEKETAKRKTSRKGSNAPFRLADLYNGTKATERRRVVVAAQLPFFRSGRTFPTGRRQPGNQEGSRQRREAAATHPLTLLQHPFSAQGDLRKGGTEEGKAEGSSCNASDNPPQHPFSAPGGSRRREKQRRTANVESTAKRPQKEARRG